ncbi:MAG: hypothetical protein GXP55_07205 [Deltaproteobacteria bacterium]|nr:hypothetical protein [Deltaproteobacteria bacterium]
MSSLRLLIDNALSPQVVAVLTEAGYDVVHVQSLHMGAARDEEILERALLDGRVVVTRDSDFAQLLALRAAGNPSVVVLRGSSTMKPVDQAATLERFLPQVALALRDGAVVTLDGASARTRCLPLG